MINKFVISVIFTLVSLGANAFQGTCQTIPASGLLHEGGVELHIYNNTISATLSGTHQVLDSFDYLVERQPANLKFKLGPNKVIVDADGNQVGVGEILSFIDPDDQTLYASLVLNTNNSGGQVLVPEYSYYYLLDGGTGLKDKFLISSCGPLKD